MGGWLDASRLKIGRGLCRLLAGSHGRKKDNGVENEDLVPVDSVVGALGLPATGGGKNDRDKQRI